MAYNNCRLNRLHFQMEEASEKHKYRIATKIKKKKTVLPSPCLSSSGSSNATVPIRVSENKIKMSHTRIRSSTRRDMQKLPNLAFLHIILICTSPPARKLLKKIDLCPHAKISRMGNVIKCKRRHCDTDFKVFDITILQTALSSFNKNSLLLFFYRLFSSSGKAYFGWR